MSQDDYLKQAKAAGHNFPGDAASKMQDSVSAPDISMTASTLLPEAPLPGEGAGMGFIRPVRPQEPKHSFTDGLSLTIPIPGATHHFPNNDGLNTMNYGGEVDYALTRNTSLAVRDFKTSYDTNALLVGAEYLHHVPHMPEGIRAGMASGLDVTALAGGGYKGYDPISPVFADARLQIGNTIVDIVPGHETAVSLSVRVPLDHHEHEGAKSPLKKIKSIF